jgi:RNA polymerase sigma-70 factor (ECF subfamily)
VDLVLIRRSQAGDEEAFAALFHAYKNLVYRTAYLMLDDAGEAEDVLQEVFYQVHRSLAAFDPAKGAFTTWLHRITVNQCLNRRRRPRLPVLSLERLFHLPWAGHVASLEDRLADEEVVGQALRQLSDKLRAAVVLRYYRELSYDEIAQILEIPVGTVKSRLDAALKVLRRQLEPVVAENPEAKGIAPKEERA